MAEVNPAEISAILKQQLSGFSDGADLNEVGTVLEVGDGIARAYGLANAQSGELVQFENGQKGIVLNLEEDNVGIVLLAPSTDIKEGTTVKRTNTIASINVGEGVVGRVVDTLGKPIDGKGPIQGETFELPLERKAPGVIFRQPVNEPMQTGIKSIDAMIPIGRGQRELIIGDRQTGKTTVAIDTIINQKEFFDKGVRKALQLQVLPRRWKTLVQCSTLRLLRRTLLILHRCSSMRHLLVQQSVSTSAIQVVQA
jgi:F-type H+-transporting ATPase subunit alpha